jgi:hypothetical protein
MKEKGKNKVGKEGMGENGPEGKKEMRKGRKMQGKEEGGE